MRGIDQEIVRLHSAAEATPPDDPTWQALVTMLYSALLERYEHTRKLEHFEAVITCAREIVRLSPEASPGLPGWQSELAMLLYGHYRWIEDPQDIVDAKGLTEEALGNPALRPAERLQALEALSDCLFAEHKAGNLDLLEESIEQLRTALSLESENQARRLRMLNDLSSRLHRLYTYTGNQGALWEAVSLAEEAAAKVPPAHESVSLIRSNLPAILIQWAEWDEQPREVLKRAVELSRDLLPDLARNHPLRPSVLANLSLGLIDLYGLTGDKKALDEALSMAKEANQKAYALPNDELFFILLRHVEALRLAFQRTGDRNLLDLAIVEAGRASNLPLGPFDRQAILVELSVLHTLRHAAVGARRDMEAGIQFAHEAVEIRPGGRLVQLSLLCNLVSALVNGFQVTGDEELVGEAIRLAEIAVEDPGAGPALFPKLYNLSVVLFIRYERMFDFTDLSAALTACVEAQGHIREGDPEWDCLHLMSWILFYMALETGDRDVLEAAVESDRRALEVLPAGHPQRVGLLDSLGFHLAQRHLWIPDAAVLSEAIAVFEEALAELEVQGEAVPHTVQWILNSHLARTLMDRDQGNDLEVAERHLSALLEQQVAELGIQTGETATLDYLRGREDPYQWTVSCRITLADRHGQDELACHFRESAWEAAELGKGRLLAALMSVERQAFRPEADLAQLVGRIDELQALMARTQRAAGPSFPMVGPQLPGGAAAPRWGEMLAEYRRSVRQIKEQDPELASLIAIAPQPLIAVQQAVPLGAALLEIYPLASKTVLFLLDGCAVRTALAPVGSRQIEEWTQELDNAVQDPTRAESAEALGRLLGQLAEPLAPALHDLLGERPGYPACADAPELLVVPTGPLHRWPLHLLPFGDGVLWDAFAVTYLPTADTLVYCAARVTQSAAPPLILAPDMALPGAVAEAALASNLGWQIALRDLATPERLAEPWAELALATHVQPDASDGSLSRISLWAGDGPKELSAAEILQQLRGRVTGQHAQLGACAAHYEKVHEGDHLQGLTRAFLALGLRSLTSTLWPIDDFAACYIGSRFRELVAGTPARSRALVLRQASLELRDGGWKLAASYLEEYGAALSEPAARGLVDAVVAALSLHSGEPDRFVDLWQKADEATMLEPGSYYRDAFSELAARGYGGLYSRAHMRAADDWSQWQKPVRALDWAASILIGYPLPHSQLPRPHPVSH